MRPSISPLSVPALLVAALFTLPACESAPPASTQSSVATTTAQSSKIEQEVSSQSKVVAVDAAARLVTLRGEDGRLRQIRCGEAVRNFDQIAVGDTLQVRYREALTATVLPADTNLREARGFAVAARAAEGETPAAGFGVAVSVRVEIESIDASRDIVVFSTSAGELISHRIATATGREFVRKLKVGDKVQLDYDEALALGIEKVAR
ncbi:MAG: hypothetical protein IPN34_16280 [Planctomycetes bacterium]|nr:hypothetical protein [Planctomycetota bacterium]